MTDQAHENANKWTPDQERLILWLALPKAEKSPKTQAALAKDLCIDEATIWRWKQLPGFREAVNKLARELVQDDLPEVLGVIRRKAKDGELVYVNMVLAMAGMSTDIEGANAGGNTLNVVISYANDKPNPS